MPISSRLQGDSVLVDGVDVKRLARVLKHLLTAPDWKAPASLDQSMEMVAKCLGYGSLHALFQEAKRATVMPSKGDHFALFSRPSLSGGEPFPKNLNPKFGKEWQVAATELFDAAQQAVRHDMVEFVALVGRPGSGKSLLARHIAHRDGGAVLNLGELTHQQGLHDLVANPRPLMVVDWPSEPMFNATEASGLKLPFPLTTPFSTSFVVGPSLWSLVEAHPDTVVVVFHDDAQVAEFIHMVVCPNIRADGENGGTVIDSARVVNLESMRTYRLTSERPRRVPGRRIHHPS